VKIRSAVWPTKAAIKKKKQTNKQTNKKPIKTSAKYSMDGDASLSVRP